MKNGTKVLIYIKFTATFEVDTHYTHFTGEKIKSREVKRLVHVYVAARWQHQDSSPGSNPLPRGEGGLRTLWCCRNHWRSLCSVSTVSIIINTEDGENGRYFITIEHVNRFLHLKQYW